MTYQIPPVASTARNDCIAALNNGLPSNIFQGIKGGLSSVAEEEFYAEKRYNHYWEHHSPVSIEHARRLARRYGVSDEGSKHEILERIEKMQKNLRGW